MRRLIIDTDPGVDDAFAIALAATSPDVELLALTAESLAAVGSLDGAKNRPASSRRHTASVCQGASWSLSRTGTRWAGTAATCRDECGGCSTVYS